MRQLTMTLYIKHQQARYSHAKKRKDKSQILNDFCYTTGYKRKYAITVLKHKVVGWKEHRLGRRKIYDPEELSPYLKDIWLASNQMCSKRLHAALPIRIASQCFEPKRVIDNRQLDAVIDCGI